MQVEDYAARWPEQFRVEAAALRAALGEVLDGDVEHIGSTSIAGMPAKPIIDMLAPVRSLADCAPAFAPLRDLDYIAHQHRVDAVRFAKADAAGTTTHHLHLTTRGSDLWRERLAFRDAVRADSRLRGEYAELKAQLLARHPGRLYDARDKRDFVRAVLAAAGVVLRDDRHFDVATWLAQVSIDAAVTELCPGYHAVVLVAEDLQPGPSDDASDALLRAGEDRAKALLAGRSLEALEPIEQWRAAYRAFGAKPQRTRSSVEALLRRVDSGLPRVDRLTDAYNAVSIAHLVPIGGEDLDGYVGAARLARAAGDEAFDTTDAGVALLDHPDPGEVVWRDTAGVTCRRWNWRQCVRTRITGVTTRAVFILDRLDPVGVREVGAERSDGVEALSAADELREHLARLCPGARFETRVL